MALPFSFIGAGYYTNPASPVAVNVPLSDRPDWFFLRDISSATASGWGGVTGGPPATNYAAIANVSSEWFSNMAAGSYLQTGQAASAIGAAALYPTKGTSGGFTFIDTSNPPTFTSLASTAINKTTFVVTMAITGSIAVGDWVRIINPVGMLQVGGLIAQVTAVTANTSITLGYIATAVTAGLSFSANATSASIKKLYPSRMYPRERQIMYITQATQAVVYFAEQNDFTAGELVDFTIPAQYGMQELSYLTRNPGGAARVLSVTNSSTQSSITLDYDTTGFTAFSYPASASIQTGGGSPATCYPAGSGVVPLSGSATVPQSPPGTNLQDAFDNRNQYLMNIGTSVVGAASATMQWVAMKADYGSLSNA